MESHEDLGGANMCRICLIIVDLLSNLRRICVGSLSNLLNNCWTIVNKGRIFVESVPYVSNTCRICWMFVEHVEYPSNPCRKCRIFGKMLSNICRIFVDYVEYVFEYLPAKKQLFTEKTPMIFHKVIWALGGSSILQLPAYKTSWKLTKNKPSMEPENYLLLACGPGLSPLCVQCWRLKPTTPTIDLQDYGFYLNVCLRDSQTIQKTLKWSTNL